MSTYSIPSEFIIQFDNIIKIQDDDLKALSHLISDLKIAENFDDVLEKSKGVFKSISPVQLQGIIRALVSIVDIFEASNKDIEAFTDKFAKSYLYSKNGATEEESLILKEKLSVLLRNFKSLIITVKSQNLLTDNQRNFRDCRVITDIRMVFEDDMKSVDKYAIVLHNLKIEYSENKNLDDFFVALDLPDLKKLKIAVDRAIEKDEIIKKTHHKFKFVDF